MGFLVSLGHHGRGIWAEWDEDFSGSSPKEGQHSGRDGLITPTDIVPKAVCRGLNSWPQKVHWCPRRLPSLLPGIDQPCWMKLLLLNTSSARKSEERKRLQKDYAILNAPLCRPWLLPSHLYGGDVWSSLQVRSSREFLLYRTASPAPLLLPQVGLKCHFQGKTGSLFPELSDHS